MLLPSLTRLPLALMVGGCLIAGAGPASAQEDLNGRSLGGYGAISAEAMSGPGENPLIPYAGGFAGFMPYRMKGGDGALAFRTVPDFGDATDSVLIQPVVRGWRHGIGQPIVLDLKASKRHRLAEHRERFEPGDAAGDGTSGQ